MAIAPPRPRKTPPTDHEAITHTAARAKAGRAAGGTAIRWTRTASRSVWGPAPDVSGTRTTTPASNAARATPITTYGWTRGDDDEVATTPARSTPAAMPKLVVELLVSAPTRAFLVGCSSMIAAAADPVTSPTPSPCTTRAAISQATEGAAASPAMLSTSSTRPVITTGRRPIASDSRPNRSSGTRTASAYTA